MALRELKKIRARGLSLHRGYAKVLKQLEKAERAKAANSHALGRQEEALRVAEERCAEERVKTFAGLRSDEEGAREQVREATQVLRVASGELRTASRALDVLRKLEQQNRRDAEEHLGALLRDLHSEAVAKLGKTLRALAEAAADEEEIREVGMAVFGQADRPGSEHRIVQFLRPLPLPGETLGDPDDPNSRIAIWMQEAAQHGYKV